MTDSEADFGASIKLLIAYFILGGLLTLISAFVDRSGNLFVDIYTITFQFFAATLAFRAANSLWFRRSSAVFLSVSYLVLLSNGKKIK